MPKSVNFKRVHAMLATKEKAVTRFSLEFLNDVFPVFEEFLLLFQKECPIVHIFYDSLCHIFLRLLRRFMVRSAIDKKYGCDWASIECKDIELQLSDKDIVIGLDTRKLSKTCHMINRNMLCLEYDPSSVSQLQSFKVTFEE